MEPFNLTAWLRTHLDANWAEHPRRADLVVIGTDAVADVAVDAGQLGRAVDAVVDHALRRSPAGTPIAVTVARHSQSILMTVDDFGPGLSEAERDRLLSRCRGDEDLCSAAQCVREVGGSIAALPRPAGLRLGIGSVEPIPSATGLRIAIVLPAVGG